MNCPTKAAAAIAARLRRENPDFIESVLSVCKQKTPDMNLERKALTGGAIKNPPPIRGRASSEAKRVGASAGFQWPPPVLAAFGVQATLPRIGGGFQFLTLVGNSQRSAPPAPRFSTCYNPSVTNRRGVRMPSFPFDPLSRRKWL